MTSQNAFDLSGDLRTHLFGELLVEMASAKLSGSFRVSRGDQKLIVYFDNGEVVFAVSNARKFRLFDSLLRENRIDKQALGKTPNFANDIEFAAVLKEEGILTENEVQDFFTKQVGGILLEALGWLDGQWTFSPLARLRTGIRTEVKVNDLLIDHARSFSVEAISVRFKGMQEKFALAANAKADLDLDPQEAFVLSRLTPDPNTLADVRFLTGLQENEALKTLYTLWFAGLIARHNWEPAFSDTFVSHVRNANLKLTKSAAVIQKPKAPEPPDKPAPAKEEEPVPEFKEISLDEYLTRVENAESHYDILGVKQDAKLPEIRNSYFELAKMFHPDRYHRAEAEILRRVENAFSKLAQAHEALRDPKSRTKYDNELRRQAADKKLQGEKPMEVKVHGNLLNSERAGQEFEHGRGLLSDGDYEEALPYLARAAHLDPQVARYHAFFGKALSFTDNGRHKAEGEMQAAIRLEPNNATYRLMLAEFFVNVKLLKRAEGELNRLLGIAPDNKEARALLDSLKQK
jgi:curved DNA-binding protein CbpA